MIFTKICDILKMYGRGFKVKEESMEENNSNQNNIETNNLNQENLNANKVENTYQYSNISVQANNVNQSTLNNKAENIIGTPIDQPVENKVEQFNTNILKQNNNHKKSRNVLIICTILIALVALIFLAVFITRPKEKNEGKEVKEPVKNTNYKINGNSLTDFDLYFLKEENNEENKVYSPLSIKYALAMLEEGTSDRAKEEISNVIGTYDVKKYTNSKNISFANALFIKNSYKESIKQNYIDILNNKFNAELVFDSFDTPDNINSWVDNNTLGLINNLFDDVSDEDLILINALAIDMEWEEKFILYPGAGFTAYFPHEKFKWTGDVWLKKGNFENVDEEISGMEIVASINNYDIVNEIGEEEIRKTVKNAFLEYLASHPYEKVSDYVDEDTTSLTDDEIMDKYLDKYIKYINSNYKKKDKTTEFSLYTDDNVKVFAKDLKEYDGVTLEYVGIMPTNVDLKTYINNTNASDINQIINNLKELKPENFKEGVVTKINGYIPKFKMEYNLDLMKDLKKLEIKEIFNPNSKSLLNISSDPSLYINKTIHKSNIEFTQEGIKAAAATTMGGAGAGSLFDYLYEVPIEEIDLTFDKPYMYLIIDKNSKEVWFVGTVYNPLLYSSDDTKDPIVLYG